MNDVRLHYDRLIDENNDSFRDPPALRTYMNRWDGDAFLELLALQPDESVLEIGVGTGRLAARTANRCAALWGVDISPKTIARARENLAELNNVHLLCGDFLTFSFHQTFDVLYSSLTFFHFPDKAAALRQAFDLLRPNGRFVLSIDKNPSCTLDMGDRRLTLYPDSPEALLPAAHAVGFSIAARRETEYAHLFCLVKPK